MSNVADYAVHRTASLIEGIQLDLSKAKECEDDAEGYYKAAGSKLQQLKLDFRKTKSRGETWKDHVRKHFDLGRERADELIRIATGKTTAKETRERTRDSHRKSRKKKRVGRPTQKSATCIEDQANNFISELLGFYMEFDPKIRAWIEANPSLDRKGRSALITALTQCAEGLQRLLQDLR